MHEYMRHYTDQRELAYTVDGLLLCVDMYVFVSDAQVHLRFVGCAQWEFASS